MNNIGFSKAFLLNNNYMLTKIQKCAMICITNEGGMWCDYNAR